MSKINAQDLPCGRVEATEPASGADAVSPLRSEQGGLLSKVLFLILLLLALATAIYLWDVGGVLRWLGVKSEQAGTAVKKQSEELGEKVDRLKEKTEEKVDKTRKQVDRLKEK